MKKYCFLLVAILALSTTLFTYEDIYAIPTSWIFLTSSSETPLNSTTPSGGGVRQNVGIDGSNIFEVIDPSKNTDPLTQETISVHLTSSADPTAIVLTLIEDGINSSVFRNDHIVMSTSRNIYSSGDTITVIIFDTLSNAPTDPNVIETLSSLSGSTISIVSETDVNGFTIETMIETGLATNLYSATFTIGPVTDASNNIIGASPGDVITIIDNYNGVKTNGILEPPVSGEKQLVVVNDDIGSFVRADFEGIISDISVLKDEGSGRGGGGIVPATVVIDSVSSGGGGCSGDCGPPTLGINQNLDRIVSHGFSYNNNPVDVELYYTPYPLITVNVGEENLAVLKIYEDGGIQNIEHVGLGFGLGKGEIFNDSKATINLDMTHDGTEIITVDDPENALENVKVVTAEEPCAVNSPTQCLVVFIYHTFREPLNFNMVATYVWDFKKNAWQNYYNHGIEIVGESLNPPKTEFVYFGTTEMSGLYELVRVDKKTDVWQDESGNLYKHFENDRFDMIYKVPKKIIYDSASMNGCDRNCNWFEYYKLHESLLAEITLNDVIMAGKPIKGEPPAEPFYYEYHMLQRSEDHELQQSMLNEIIRAEELYDSLYKSPYR
jgi:hypothetical protein